VPIGPDGLGPLAGRRFDAVLFDLDGTLIDSTPVVERTWQRWGLMYGLEPGTWTFVHGVPARQMLARLIPADEVDDEFGRVEKIELSDIDGIAVLPGALDALAALPAGRSAIATSGSAPLAHLRIAHTGLPAPAVVVTASDTPIGKPDPAPYLLAAARLGADPARCLVVEDAPAGLTAARAAGCASLAVQTTHAADQLDADALVATLADVRFTVGDDGVRIHPCG
jgi:sugar-phosphatase